MPLHVKFLEDGSVYGRTEGMMTYENTIRALRTIWEDPRFKAGTRQLLDLRELRGFEMGESDFRNIIAEAQTKADLLEDGCVAVVAPADFSFGMMQTYEQLAESLPAQIKVFRRYDDARVWLDFDEATHGSPE